MPEQKKCTILLADDDEDDRLFFKEAWNEIRSVDLVLATDGDDLLNKLHEMDILPDVIFLDLNMPKKNGLACLRDIKKDKTYNRVPVIIYSTTRNEMAISQVYKEGANLFITKPSNYTHIVSTMKNLFGLNIDDYIPQPVKEKFVFK